jgi:outer membrane protein assembly factor BamB
MKIPLPVPALGAVAAFVAACAVPYAPPPAPWSVASESTIGGFAFPESAGCDRDQNVIYVSQFGGTELKPAEKDGLGFISKIAPDGRMLEAKAFPDTMNKPKGIWVERGRLWVTDIDGVWIYDTRSKKGRKLALPGIQFANDPAVVGGVLFVSDNSSDQLFQIEPADFLDAAVQPKVSVAVSKRDIHPNGLWPTRSGTLLMVGFAAADKPRGVYALAPNGETRAISAPLGRLDGVYELRDGSGLLVTDWNTGTLSRWNPQDGMKPLARDFKGPADFCVLGRHVYVPDLVKGELRIVVLAR